MRLMSNDAKAGVMGRNGGVSSHGLGRERETGNVEHGTGSGERGTEKRESFI